VLIDGIFGPQTDRLVRGFQAAVPIAADGIVGPLTWRALVSGMLSL
jgi:peptidoglycan hydrolase-like protein with peptidoglycan-binding domain